MDIIGQPKNRKERRALEYGKAKLLPAVDASVKVVKEINSMIMIPQIPQTGFPIPRILDYMIPEKELDAKYDARHINDDISPARTPEQYHRLLARWFFSGLTHFNPTFKDNVVSTIGVGKAFSLYVREILTSFEPSSEHKFAYLTYVLDTCCTSIEWEPKERG